MLVFRSVGSWFQSFVALYENDDGPKVDLCLNVSFSFFIKFLQSFNTCITFLQKMCVFLLRFPFIHMCGVARVLKKKKLVYFLQCACAASQLPPSPGPFPLAQHVHFVIRQDAEERAYLHCWHSSPHEVVCYADPVPPWPQSPLSGSRCCSCSHPASSWGTFSSLQTSRIQ